MKLVVVKREKSYKPKEIQGANTLYSRCGISLYSRNGIMAIYNRETKEYLLFHGAVEAAVEMTLYNFAKAVWKLRPLVGYEVMALCEFWRHTQVQETDRIAREQIRGSVVKMGWDGK